MIPANHSDERSEIEQMIFEAGDYIQPSRELRPRVLDSARDFALDHRAEQKLGILAVAVLALCFLSQPIQQSFETFRHRAKVPSAEELQQHALSYASRPDIGTQWGLAEAFTQLRTHQADRLGTTSVRR